MDLVLFVDQLQFIPKPMMFSDSIASETSRHFSELGAFSSVDTGS